MTLCSAIVIIERTFILILITMNQLMRNRLIGGAVLVFAGALFVPAILNPDAKPLSNPNLAINLKTNTPVVDKPTVTLLSAKPAEATQTPTTEPLTLASIGDEAVATTAARPSGAAKPVKNPAQKQSTAEKPLMNISLESIDDKPSAVKKTQQNSRASSWLRVGSFSSQVNADKLAASLQSARYPVKIETITIDGKGFQRVLVGPFSDEKKMQKIMQSIQARGYNPSVQR